MISQIQLIFDVTGHELPHVKLLHAGQAVKTLVRYSSGVMYSKAQLSVREKIQLTALRERLDEALEILHIVGTKLFQRHALPSAL